MQWINEKQQGWVTERSNNLWNRSNTATPPVMIEPTVTNIGTNRISRDFSVGDGKAGATAAVFSRSSVTQNIISTHTLPLVKPCETPFTASPFPPVCSTQRLTCNTRAHGVADWALVFTRTWHSSNLIVSVCASFGTYLKF